MKRIESRDNKWIKRLNGLKIKKNRDKEGLFIAEGLRFIREIPKNWEVLAYAVSDAFAAENDLSLYEEKAEVLCLTDALFAAVCDTENPQGILAVCKKLDWDADAVLAKKTPFLLLAEELNDPGNLGTILRTADAVQMPFFSARAVLIFITRRCCAQRWAVCSMCLSSKISTCMPFRKKCRQSRFRFTPHI